MRVSSLARLTIWYTLALLLVLSLFAGNLVLEQERVGLRRVDRELDALGTTVVDVLRDELTEEDDLTAVATDVRGTISAPARALAIFDSKGAVLAARWNGLSLANTSPLQSPATFTVATPGGQWRVHTIRVPASDTSLRVLVAAPMTDANRERGEVLEAMFVAIPIVLVLAGGGGLWLASVSVRPINRALALQRQFMADASHELRTPVAVVRAAADVTLSREHREEQEYREALTMIRGQAQSMTRLVDDLMVLARADAGGYPLQPVDLYLDEVIDECRRSLDLLARTRDIIIRMPPVPEIPFRGDQDLLRRAVTNVLQNAVQHTPAGGVVTIDVAARHADVVVRISDSGPGIPADQQARVFDRFVQLDPSRRSEGAGVGLPIARWIAEAHEGTLVLETSGPGGSTFSFTLPRLA